MTASDISKHKAVILTIAFSLKILNAFCQYKCSDCDSLKRKSRQEYSYEAYQKHYKNCISRDTIYYNQTDIVKEKGNANIYTITEKESCGTYVSKATYSVAGNKLIRGYSLEDRDTIFWTVNNQEAQMQKIIPEIMNYVSKNINYPAKCKRENIQGKVFLTFILNEEGTPMDAYVIKSPDILFSVEAVRVINSVKNIGPIKNNGTPVKVKLNIPISFKLN
jgi:TonB family protein